MVSKNNKKLIAEKNRRNEKQRFAIRKLNVGVASVLLGITFSIYGGGQVVAHADTGNASDQVAASDTGDSLADKQEVALSSANQSSTSATNANGTVQSEASANSQTATPATTSASATASNATVEATKDQSTAKIQSSDGQEVQTSAQAQPVTQENGSSDASLNTTRQALNTIALRKLNSGFLANYLMLSADVPGSGVEAEDPNAVTVSDAKGFINAIQNGTATTINVAKDLNLAEQTDSKYTEIKIKNKRNIVIQSDNPEEKRTIDFSGYSFDMDTQNSVTFKDLNIYARSYWGLVYNAGGYTFDNVNFTGSQLIYTKPWINSTLTFKNNITANSVSSYVGPLDGKTRDTQQNGGQQILQFEGGTNQIIFDENSNVTLTTEDANALEIDGGTTTIDVKDGANVAINPHSKGDPESRNGIGTGDVARAIAANAKMTINIDPNSTLTINTEKVDGDKDVAGALYLNSDADLNVNGKLVINSNGTPSANKSNGVPVYINGSAKINVGNGGSFSLDATNLENYSSSLISINGKGTVKLDPHSSFKISGDGTGALTAINLSSGSTFTSNQPNSFTIDLSKNTSNGKSLIKNGTINFSRVKTVTDGSESQPLGKIDVTYDKNGNATKYLITAQNENTVKQVGEGLTNKNSIDLVKAGEDVTLSNLHLSKKNVLTGTVASSGSNNPIYVTVTVGGVSTNVPVLDHYTVYTNTNGTVTSNNIDYAAQTASTGGNFSIDLSKLASSLTDDTQVKVTATKDFVEGAQTESVAALRALNTTTLKELVDAAPAEKAKPSYYNATAEAQKAYTDAISTGKTILANPNNYDQVDVDNAVTAIQNAQKALTGEPTNKTELQAAVDDASKVESSDNYTNADADLQKAYTDAISAGQKVLSNVNATQTEVNDALTTINNAKDALNGDAKKAASKEALQKAVDEAPTVKSDDAAYYNGSDEAKAAYDRAISDGQKVLDDSDATATQITAALDAINAAKGNLKGEATDKAALKKAVDNSATVKESNNYTNADEPQKAAYDKAVTDAQTVLDKTNATQAEVNQALQDLETANNNLNGDAKKAASKEALQKAVDEAPTVKSDDAAYYNGSDEAKKAYDEAITAGQTVLADPDATATQITAALDAINTAKGNLKGEATDKSALQKAVANSTTVKESNNYTNADKTQKTAYDNAVTAAQTVLDKTNATQAEVNQALKDLETANNNLNGDAKTEAANKAALEAAVKDAPNVRNTPAYYNGSEEAQTAYNSAINAGQAVLDQANPSANDVKTALDAINAAKDNLKGKATNTEALETALTNANNAKETGNYTNADQANQEALNNAIIAGQEILKNTSATQAQVDSAAKAITDAISGLNGDTNLTNAKNAATEDIQKALDTKTTQITDATNIDQATKDQLIADAKKAAEDANTTINQATNADAVNSAKTEGITNINNVTVPSLDDAKTNAAKEIDQALTDKTKKINNAENIDQTTKDQLIKEATDAATTAKDAIEKATTNDAATKAGQAGVEAINNVKIPSLDGAKQAANQAIDQALDTKTKEINAANNIDQTTKDQLIKEATDAANTAKDAIEKATTNDAATKAGQAGVEAINNVKVPSVTDSQNAAKDAIDDALNAKTKEINAANNIDQTTKDQLIKEATDAANNAKEAIDKATTADAIKTAQDEGTTNINNVTVPSLEDAKKAATKAVADALTAQTEVINKADNLSDTEKKDLIDQATAEANKAKENIETATTNNEAAQAGQAGVDAIKKIVPTSLDTVKSDANKAIEAALTKKLEKINSANALTTDEKTALTQEATTAADKAKAEITKATTNDAVIEAQNNGVTAIDGIKVPTESAVKEAAKQAVADAATAKNNAIDASNLTDEEKAALKQEVTEAQKAADQAIDNATTNAAVTEAQTNGIKAIDGIEVPTTSANKEKAVTDLNTAAENAKKAIDQDNNLTNEEKQAAKDQIDSDAKTAQEAIDNATTNDDVKKAAAAGTLAIDKDAANAAIDNAVAGKKAEISNSPLTDEEKNALNNEVNQKAQAAKEAIKAATTPEAVTTAQGSGVKNINDTSVPAESDAKQAAKQAVAEAADAKNKAIDSSNLTDEEKAALKQKVTEAQKAADQAIDNATTNAAVTEAQTDGVTTIDDIKVPTESAVKEAAKQAVADAVTAKNAAIDASNLTDEEKATLKQEVADAQNAANTAIDNATTNAAVTEAEDKGVKAINGIDVPAKSDAKEKATTDLNNEVENAKNAIDQDSNLTDEQKQAAKDQIDSDAKTAQDAINNAKTNDDVKKAVDDGTLAIDKDVANAAIDNAAAGKLKEIQDPLTTEEKQAYTDLINSEANNAKQNIANATTVEEVTTAQTNGVNEITNTEIPTTSSAKDKAIAAINDALQKKTDEINSASNLNTQEKTDLIKQATDAANTAKNNINNATTNAAVETAQTNGEKAIADVTVPNLSDVKKESIDLINKALDAKTDEINNASNLSQDEKQSLINDATNAATEAINNVNQAQTNDDAKAAATTGVQNIENVKIPSLDDAKKNANQAIEDALNAKVNEINNASNLNETEKQKLVDQANEAAATAKNNVENATTNDGVRDAANAGIDSIKGITFTSLEDAKNAANTAIDNALKVKTDEINNASNLSTEEKQDLINQASEVAKTAKDNINNATTNDAVTATRDDAIKQITDLFIPTLDGAQTDAINAIESAKNAKLNDINNATHLTDQEKQALVDQTNKVADEATEAINAAQTNDEVKSAETAGLDSINNITIPTLVQKQQEAIEELNAARDAKNSAIDNAADLTTDEKNALKDKVQAEYSNAVSNITSATTDEAVTTAKENGIAAIKDIQIPTKSAAKEQATTDLNNAVDDAKKAIDQDNNLTDAEKQAAKDQIDSDAKKAQEAIDNAKTDDEVNSAVDNGKLAIDKDIANAAINNAVAGKKDEISKSPLTDEEKTALNNEVDQKAQDAKEAINNATTPEAVTTAQENGIKNINDTEVPAESAAKEAAKKVIAEVAEAKNNTIDSSNLTDEEKAALKQEVTDAQNAANTAIDNATTNAAVNEAEDNGIKAINGIEIPTKSPAKEQATTDLNDAVDDAKKAIDQDSNLTDTEKQAAKDQIDSDAKKAQEAIDNAKTDDEVKTAVDNGQLAIDKDVANAAIDNAVAGKKAEIAKAPLTTDEAKNLNDLVDQEAKAAKNAIDSATTIPAVENAKNTGIAAINNIAVPTTSSTKDQANQTIDDALANKIKEINDATNLSDKQKQDLIDQANNAANTAKDNITKATSDSEVATATTDGIDAIANVTVPSLETAKDQAKNMIDDVLNEKKNEINNAQNLSDSQKQDLINQATDEADQAKKNIDNATTNNDVQTAEDNGAQAIENVTVPSLDDAKKASTKVIDEVLKEKTAEINAATNLSNAEKDALIKDATTAANTAKDNIAKATTNDAVKDAETDGVKALLDIKVPGREDQQKDAIAALDRALADKVSEINNANNLSETTKEDLKQQAQAAYTTAVDNVNNAQTSAEINTARDNGVQAILDITVPTLTDAQNASITAVEQVRDAKKTQIEAAKNLTETQKEALKNQVDEIADKAIDNIKNATTDATVKDAETAGINEILNVTIPTLDAAKSDAKQAIADALTAKTAEINAAQNLTDAEKQKLIDQAQTEAAAANKNIDAATTNDAAELAAKNGVQAILDIQVPTVEETRDQAKKNVDNALNSKKEEINNSNLSPAAKEALINEAEQAAENARTAIDNATTASAISEAEAAGIAAIENIKVSNAPTESDNFSNHQTNTETPTEGNSTSQDNNNATQAPVQGNNTQAGLTGSHGTNLTTGQQTEKAADTNSKKALPQTGNETERGLGIAGLAIASLLGLFGLLGLGKKRD